MKLYAVYTDGAAILKDDWFLKSLQDDWELNILQVGATEKKYGDFSTPGFKDVVKKKTALILDSIKDNFGDVIIWSDLDIQFFGKCSDTIEYSIKEKDVVFQSERGGGGEVNAGFMAIRCNRKTIEFWQAVLKRVNSSEWNQPEVNDQSIINGLLRKKSGDIEYDIFPNCFWAKSHPGKPPRDILLHHANCTAPRLKKGRLTGSMELKIEQLSEIRRLVEDKKDCLRLPRRWSRFIWQHLGGKDRQRTWRKSRNY
ncbi:MAG: putative nucleotide-diphospho-sugar transferase [Candidatus Omnitrophota bacterium]